MTIRAQLPTFSARKLRFRPQVVAFGLLFASHGLPQTIATEQSDKSSGQIAASEQVRLSEILISTPQPYDPEQVARAQRKAAEIREVIRRGGDFADFARTSSQGPTAKSGGEIGYFGHGSLARSLEDVVFQMKVGDVSDVIRTKQGFVILKVMDRKAAGARLDSFVEILAKTTSPELRAYTEALKDRIRLEWYGLIPKSAQSKRGGVSVEISVRRDGTVSDQKISSSSGDSDLDEAALNAVNNAGPYSPLPKSVKADHVTLLFHFEYNPATASVPK